MKKKWETPQLVVLLRGRPGEAVLQVCKVEDGIGGPDGQGANDCIRAYGQCETIEDS